MSYKVKHQQDRSGDLRMWSFTDVGKAARPSSTRRVFHFQFCGWPVIPANAGQQMIECMHMFCPCTREYEGISCCYGMYAMEGLPLERSKIVVKGGLDKLSGDGRGPHLPLQAAVRPSSSLAS